MIARTLLAGIALMFFGLCGCDRAKREREEYASRITGGDPSRGQAAIQRLGCITCHDIPGLPDTAANVGPPLSRVGSRVYLAGVLVNTPANMTLWLKNPPGVDPKTAMPNVGASDDEVRNIAAYLYTLR